MSIYPKGRFGEAHRQPGVVVVERLLWKHSRVKDYAYKNDKKIECLPRVAVGVDAGAAAGGRPTSVSKNGVLRERLKEECSPKRDVRGGAQAAGSGGGGAKAGGGGGALPIGVSKTKRQRSR
jgi:hypothetical protein